MGVFGYERYEWAWVIGLVFAALADVLSIILIHYIYIYNSHKRLKQWEILCLLMVPIYATSAWFGLVFKDATPYIDLLRETYEAIALYSFYQFLVTYLGGRQHVAIILAIKEQPAVVRWKIFQLNLPV